MAQLPLVSNNAITVHKAQGVSAANIVIADFGGSAVMATYVALSRARTLASVHQFISLCPSRRASWLAALRPSTYLTRCSGCRRCSRPSCVRWLM